MSRRRRSGRTIGRHWGDGATRSLQLAQLGELVLIRRLLVAIAHKISATPSERRPASVTMELGELEPET